MAMRLQYGKQERVYKDDGDDSSLSLLTRLLAVHVRQTVTTSLSAVPASQTTLGPLVATWTDHPEL